MISIRNLSYRYDAGHPFEKVALSGIDLDIEDSSFVGLAGSTGSGKSTLLRCMAGLLKAQDGTVLLDGKNICEYENKALRRKVGIVFQFPEYQIFEETVEKDVMFGPLNMGLSKEEALEKAHWALELVGLDKKYFRRSPFSLSGGEKRRVAIAGTLAMDSSVLLLDEPAAGLDPRMHNEIFSLLKRLNEEGKTIVIVSHNMDDIANYCTKLAYLDTGKVLHTGKPEEVFQYPDVPKPFALRVSTSLREKGFEVPDTLDLEELSSFISSKMKR